MNCKCLKTEYQRKYFDLKERDEMRNMQTANVSLESSGDPDFVSGRMRETRNAYIILVKRTSCEMSTSKTNQGIGLC
jgi:hypothetical protein